MIACKKYLASVSHNVLAIRLEERDVVIRSSQVLPGIVFVNLSSMSVTRLTRKVEGFGGALSLSQAALLPAEFHLINGFMHHI
jgi:hypothetical protein